VVVVKLHDTAVRCISTDTPTPGFEIFDLKNSEFVRHLQWDSENDFRGKDMFLELKESVIHEEEASSVDEYIVSETSERVKDDYEKAPTSDEDEKTNRMKIQGELMRARAMIKE